MIRQSIFEILSSEYDIVKEFNKINSLFELKIITYTDPLSFRVLSATIEEVVDNVLLLMWKQRGSYFSCGEMREAIGFDTCNYNEDNIITTLEYYLNLINLINSKLIAQVNTSYQFYKEFYLLVQNIDILLEHLNLKKIIIDEEEKLLLLPENPTAVAVAEISTKNTAFSILKYNHASLKGNIDEKKKILYLISQEYEPLLKAPIEGYKDFFEKTNALLNNLHIRHNNKTKENNKNKIIDIDENELEQWYDELYQLLLFCILINDNLKRKNNVDELLKKIKLSAKSPQGK